MNARQTALLILNEIEQKKTYANLSIKKMLDMADAGEKAIASKIELGSKVIIVAMSIPIISSLLELIIEILP